MRYSRLFMIFFLSLFFSPILLVAQTVDYTTANRLLQQQKYEEAKMMFKQMHEGNPSVFIFYDRYIEALISTKDFDKAIEVSQKQLERNQSAVQTRIRLGEIYHTMGNRNKALEIWNEVISQNRNSIQTYYNVGSSMTSRMEYEAAANLYRKARELAGNNTLFTNELANSLMQSGNYQEAMSEYFKLVTNSPDQMTYVQQRLLRLRDDSLYETAAIELEDYLLELDTDHEAYKELHQLLTWMLIETGQYRRALIVSRQYETRTSGLNYSLYSVASQLNSIREFELAGQGYQYYIENGTTMIRFRSMHQLANVYYDWGQYIQDFNTESYNRQMELFRKAYDLNSQLAEQASRYDRIGEVYVKQFDMSLDIFSNIEWAREWQNRLSELNDSTFEAHKLYAEGRLNIFKGDFTAARQYLTRSNRIAEDSRLAENVRYLLSETDFFSKDYEFSKIQLLSLERRETSYFANDALKLRLWIQEGLQADSTGSFLDDFSSALYQLETGQVEKAVDLFKTVINDPANPLKENALVELLSRTPVAVQISLKKDLENLIENGMNSPLRERLLWERARISKILFNSAGLKENKTINDESAVFDLNEIPAESDLIGYFEQLLIEFPNGFYAPFARQEIRNIQEKNT